MNRNESGNQAPSPSSSLPPLRMTNPRELMIKEDSETNQNENGNQAPSLPPSRMTYPTFFQNDEEMHKLEF